MVAIIVGIILGIGVLVWIWKVPVSKTVISLKEGGSSTFEAWFILVLVILVIIMAVWMIYRVV